VSLGAGVGIAAGPIGRSGTGAIAVGADGDLAPILSYSASRGLFAGVSLEGTVIVARPDVNCTFYGRQVGAGELLSGAVPPPSAATPLYEALAAAHLAAQYGGV
jgi:SH3 domain-containing YSC84-like protein 1